jgi:hypothetical protein
MKYVLWSGTVPSQITLEGYYTGASYICQGEKYAVNDTDLSKAKRYTSYNRANSAKAKLDYVFANVWRFTVKEIAE